MHDWIRDVLERRPELTRAGLAKAINKDPSVASKIASGARRVHADELSAIVDYLGEPPPTDILRNLATLPSSKAASGFVEVTGTEYAALPRFDAGISAGFGSLLDDNPEPLGYHLVEAQWLRSVTRATPNHLIVVRVDGDSMEPTLSEGDWILVDRSQTRPTREGLYVLRVGPDVWVKRLTVSLRDKRVVVISDNPAYPEERLPDDELEIIGRVVWIVGRRV